MFVRCSNSSSNILAAAHQNTQTVIDATQKETAIEQQQQQQHSCETLICQRHQTILRLLSSAATARTRWRVRELYCWSKYIGLYTALDRCHVLIIIVWWSVGCGHLKLLVKVTLLSGSCFQIPAS